MYTFSTIERVLWNQTPCSTTLHSSPLFFAWFLVWLVFFSFSLSTMVSNENTTAPFCWKIVKTQSLESLHAVVVGFWFSSPPCADLAFFFSLLCFVFSVYSGLLALLFLWFWFWGWKAQLLRIERVLFCLTATGFVFISLRCSWPFSDPALSGNEKVNVFIIILLCFCIFFFPLFDSIYFLLEHFSGFCCYGFSWFLLLDVDWLCVLGLKIVR